MEYSYSCSIPFAEKKGLHLKFDFYNRIWFGGPMVKFYSGGTDIRIEYMISTFRKNVDNDIDIERAI